MKKLSIKLGVVAVACAVLSGCATMELSPHLKPISKESMMQLGKRGMEVSSPIFIRIYKEESELEVWKQRSDGRFHHFKTYPICNWSGDLGPKMKQGDKQAPEGFYRVGRDQMNPNSQFHLAFNLGFPNAFDKAQRRTGDFLMVHGKCKSAGCYAMTDALIEEIYALARESFIGGQEIIHVHALPFRMTDANMKRHASSQWMPFWSTLKQGYDHFEQTRLPPDVLVCQRQYHVNVKPARLVPARLDPEASCPPLEKQQVTPFMSKPGEQVAEPMIVVGPKTRTASNINGAYSPPVGVGAKDLR